MVSRDVVRTLIAFSVSIALAGAGCGKSARRSSGEESDAGARSDTDAGARSDAGSASDSQGGRAEAGSSSSGGLPGHAGNSTTGGFSGNAGTGVGTAGSDAGMTGEDAGGRGLSGGSGAAASGGGGAGGNPVDGNECEPPPESDCFEPCGGDPSGVWRIEDTCFDGRDYCAGAFFIATSVENELKLHIVEGRQFEVKGSDRWDIRATLPHECLGIDSARSCRSAELYIEPLLLSFVNGLPCAENACGSCDCGGPLAGGFYMSGGVELGSKTLKLNSQELPYCVEGETLWLGGRGPDGVPKVAYKFRKQSCTGGRCEDLTEEQCPATPCRVGPDGCESVGVLCHHDYCDADLGCAWGPPVAHCGSPIGERVDGCDALSVEDCHDLPGCVIDW